MSSRAAESRWGPPSPPSEATYRPVETRSRKPQSQVASGIPAEHQAVRPQQRAWIRRGQQLGAPVPDGHATVVRRVADEAVGVDEDPPLAGPPQHVGRCRVTMHDQAPIRVVRGRAALGTSQCLVDDGRPVEGADELGQPGRLVGRREAVTGDFPGAREQVGHDGQLPLGRQAGVGEPAAERFQQGGAAVEVRGQQAHVAAPGGSAQRPYLAAEVDAGHGDLDHRRLAGRGDRGRDVRGRAAGHPGADPDSPPILQRRDRRRQLGQPAVAALGAGQVGHAVRARAAQAEASTSNGPSGRRFRQRASSASRAGVSSLAT